VTSAAFFEWEAMPEPELTLEPEATPEPELIFSGGLASPDAAEDVIA
jgi:hypothetical protein